MKRFITLVVFSCFSLMLAQDAAGTYKLVGTDVRYSSLLRKAATISATTNQLPTPVTIPLLAFGEGEGAGQIRRGPYNEFTLGTSGVFLNVTFDENGFGSINEGSYYPTIELDEETCISSGASLPITDELVYTSNLTPSNYVQTKNWIGLESLSPFAGQFLGAISLSQSEELDFFREGQEVGGQGACRAGFYIYGDDGQPLDAPAPCCFDPSPDSMNCGDDEMSECGDAVPSGFECADGNDCHVYEACMSAGYASRGHEIQTIEGNGVRDFYVEWHAVDGVFSQSGYGEDASDPCEDDLCVANANEAQCLDADGNVISACTESGEAFDRILGVPGIPATKMNPECGFDGGVDEDGVQIYEYIAGDQESVSAGLAGGVAGACVAGFTADDNGNEYPDVFDGCQALAAGGDTDPATSAFVGACTQLGFDLATCSGLAAVAQAQVEAQTICYDFVSHTFVPAASADECAASVPATDEFGAPLWDCDGDFVADDGCDATSEGAGPAFESFVIFTNVQWDCYGLLGLTYQSAGLCAAAGDAWVGQCVLGEGLVRDFIVLSENFTPWGGFWTWNALQYTGCCGALAADGINCQDVDTCDAYLVSDGSASFDPACLTDGDTSDCSGRLGMTMNGLCVPTLDVREVHIDFDEIETCAGNGDVNFDSVVNVLDILRIVQHVIGADPLTPEQFCNGDVFGDNGVVNIQDILTIINWILNPNGRIADASMVEILTNDNVVSMDADGYIGAVQMTLSHDSDFSIELTNNAFVAESHTEGNQTTLMIVLPESNELFTADGNFEIVETIATNSNDLIDVINPEAISLGQAYPNPFNPTTSFDLKVGVSGHVTMNVYNLVGQVVGTLVNNTMDVGNYNITWDAGNFASGMYIVKAETVNGVASQKVMLVK